MKKHLLSFLFLNLTHSFLFAQTIDKDSLAISREVANKAYVNLYKENAEFSYSSPAGELGAPSKYVINGRLTGNFMLFGSYKSPVAFAAVPDYTVRVRKEFSAGVRTPSYRFGGIFYARLNPAPLNYKYAELAFTHHSNGQDEDAVNPDGTINTRTGNFNANNLALSYRFGHLNSGSSNDSYYSYNHRVGFQWYKWFRYEPALNQGFGFTRLLYNFSWRKYGEIERMMKRKPQVKSEKEIWRLNTELTYAVNKIPSKGLANLQKD
ncbi:hypothetical protein [Pedobacter mendelii]|uniref:hypothetical protein n=1 Tax=Pedobacter mendelii TaxID=1908240 RepID=UPI003631A788